MPDDINATAPADPTTPFATPGAAVVSSPVVVSGPATGSIDPLDHRLIWTASSILVLVSVLLVAALGVLWFKYTDGMHVALQQATPDHAAALSYARALDAGTVKITALLLGFVIVFLGALYVLRSSTVAFSMAMSGGGVAGNLQTASPGLVMVALGMVLIGLVLFSKSDVNYTAPAGPSVQTSPPQTSAVVAPAAPVTPTQAATPEAVTAPAFVTPPSMQSATSPAPDMNEYMRHRRAAEAAEAAANKAKQ